MTPVNTAPPSSDGHTDETGFIDFRYQPPARPFGKNLKPENRWDLIEYDFDRSPSLTVPGHVQQRYYRLMARLAARR